MADCTPLVGIMRHSSVLETLVQAVLTNSVFLLDWTRPVPLEEFLLPLDDALYFQQFRYAYLTYAAISTPVLSAVPIPDQAMTQAMLLTQDSFAGSVCQLNTRMILFIRE